MITTTTTSTSMTKLFLSVIVLLVAIVSGQQQQEEYVEPAINDEDDIQSLFTTDDQQLDFIDNVAKDYLRQLKIAHNLVDGDNGLDETSGLNRHKRSPLQSPPIVGSDWFADKGVHRLRAIIPRMPTCDHPIDFTTISFNNQTYGICVSQPTGNRKAKVSVGPLTPVGWQRNQMTTWDLSIPQKVVAFVDKDKDLNEDNLFVLVADVGNRDGTNVLAINKFNRKVTKEHHTVNSKYPTAISMWRSPTDNSHHLAIANSYGPESVKSFKSETYTYTWTGTYFDRYSEMTTYFVKDICAFNIHSYEYLAVANHKAGPNNMEVDSEIFRLDIDTKKWRSFQRIRTFGAIDWEFFTFGSGHHREYFLAVANNFDMRHGKPKYDVNSVIYKYSDDKFVPFQCLATVGATQIKTYTGPDGQFVLAVANMHQAVHLYQYNGWHFVETSVQYTSGVMSPGVVSLHYAYLSFERTGVLFVSNPRHPSGHMFRLEFVYENPLGEWHKQSLGWCEATEQQVRQFGVETLMPLLKDTFFVDQIEPIVINDDLVLSDLDIGSLTTPVIVDASNGDELSHRIIDELVKLDEEITKAHAQLGQLIDLLSNAMRTDGDQIITAPQTFKSATFECRPDMDCYFQRIDTKVLNNDNIEGLAADIVPLNVDQNIQQPMHFQHMKVDNNIILNGLLNDVNTDTIVTRSGNHEILAPKTFAKDLNAKQVVVLNRINEQIINPSTVLLTTGDQIINNSITFKAGVRLNSLRVNGPVNDINIDKFFNEMVTKDDNYIIRGQKAFNNLDLNDLIMANGSTIDGIDIMELWKNVLWTYGDEEISGQIDFTDIVVGRNLMVDGLINGVKIPSDVILTNENTFIASAKQFLKPTRLDRTEVLHSINGIGLVNGNLDIMSKTREQVVSGPKTFNTIHLNGNNLVRGTVDGVKLSLFKRLLLTRNSPQHFNNLEIRGDAFFDGGLAVRSTINNLKLDDLYNKALKLTDSRIDGFPHFEMNNVFFAGLQSQSINGLNIGKDLVTKNTAQVITGHKIFANGIKLNDNINVKQINGIDFDFFVGDTLLNNGNQVITGEKTFLNNLLVKNLKTNNINKIPMNDIVLLNGDQVISAPKTFTNVQIYGDLNTESFDSQLINDVHMKDLYENTLQYDKPQTVTARLNVDTIMIPKQTNFGTKSINGVNLRALMSDAVVVDIPQVIVGPKTFVSPVTISAVKFLDNFDNVTDYELKHNWLLQDMKQTINSNIVFERNLKVDDNIRMKNPIINGINLNVVNNSTVKLFESAMFEKDTHFSGPVHSTGHIKLKGRIQGIDLDKEAVVLNGDNIINGRIHFVTGFSGNEHLYVKGTVDGVVVEDLCRTTVRQNQQNLFGPTQVTGNVLIKGPLNLRSDVNGVNIDEFIRSVLKVDEPSNVTGIKHFRKLVINGPIIVKKSVAGFRIEDFANNYMSLTRDQTVGSQLVFLNDLNLKKGLKIKGNIVTQNATINGINLKEFDANVLKTFGDQVITGDFTFESDVYFDKDLNVLNKRINGLHLVNDLMLRGRDNVITVPKIFAENIVVTNNMIIKDGKTINGVDLSEMMKNAVMKNNANNNIIGPKHMNSIEVDHLIVNLLNGFNVSEKTFLLNYGNQVIIGEKILNHDLRVNADIISKTINHIIIGDLAQNLVLKGYNNSINTIKTFKSPLTVNNVRAFGKVDGVDLNELHYFIGLPFNLNDLKNKLDFEDKQIGLVQQALDQQSNRLAYYELNAVIPFGPPLLSYQNTRSQHLFIVGQYLNNGCQEINIYTNTVSGYKLLTKLYAIDTNIITKFVSNGHHFVIVANSRNVHNWEQCLKLNKMTQFLQFGSGPQINQLFVFDGNQNSYKMIASIHSQSVSDIKVIDEYNKNACLLMATPVVNGLLSQSSVLCRNFIDGKIFLKEMVPLPGRNQYSIVSSTTYNRTLMASINSWQTRQVMSDIVISDWSTQLSHFDHSFQTIRFLNPYAIHFVEIPLQSMFYLFASERSTSLTHKPMVRIYRYALGLDKQLLEVQQIVDTEVFQIDTVLLDNKRVLVILLTTDRLLVYELKGASGFVQIHYIDAQNANSFVVSNYFDQSNKVVGHLIAIYYKKCFARNSDNCLKETHVLHSKLFHN